jgi:hypothetical protein
MQSNTNNNLSVVVMGVVAAATTYFLYTKYLAEDKNKAKPTVEGKFGFPSIDFHYKNFISMIVSYLRS